MGLPGYRAEASLYRSGRSYGGGTITAGGDAGTMVIPQQGPGCTVSCDEWSTCNQTCGQWPPGFSNYDCWLNCLKPSIDCLNGMCTPPPPPPPCCPVGRTCRCGGKCIPGRGCVNGQCLRPGESCS